MVRLLLSFYFYLPKLCIILLKQPYYSFKVTQNFSENCRANANVCDAWLITGCQSCKSYCHCHFGLRFKCSAHSLPLSGSLCSYMYLSKFRPIMLQSVIHYSIDNRSRRGIGNCKGRTTRDVADCKRIL